MLSLFHDRVMISVPVKGCVWDMNNKERIFETALDLFCEKGFSATSIRDITRSLSLSVSAFYNHFKSKNQLLQEIYKHYMNLYVEPSDTQPDYESLLDAFGPVGIFRRLAQQFIDSMLNEKIAKLGRVIVMEQYTNRTAGEIARRDRQKLITSMEEIFMLMDRKGLICVKDPVLTSRLVGYAYLGFFSDNNYDHLMEGKDPQKIILAQLEMVENFMKEIMSP